MTYDMIASNVTGSGSVTQPFYTPQVLTGATSGSTALQRFNAVYGWLSGTRNSYFYGKARMNYATYARAFIGMALADNTIILDTTVAQHCGFLFVKSPTVDKIYAVSANGSNREATDIGIQASGTWIKAHIISDKAAGEVRFYVNGVLKATHSTYLPPSALCWKMCIQNDEAANNQLTYEYHIFAQE
jgi:hypothetical protein